jgi:hypothetical protein
MRIQSEVSGAPSFGVIFLLLFKQAFYSSQYCFITQFPFQQPLWMKTRLFWRTRIEQRPSSGSFATFDRY